MQAFKFFHPFVMLFIVSTITAQKSEKIPSQNRNVTFTENKGQISDQNYNPRPDVLFSGEASGLVYHLRNDGISYQSCRIDTWSNSEDIEGSDNHKLPDQVTLYRTDINWIGSNPAVKAEPSKAIAGRSNFYLPSCPEGLLGVKSFGEVTYKNLYKGIDLRFYGKGRNLEYDYIVHPGKDYKQIAWEIKGAESLSIDKKGDLIITTPLGEIREKAPIAFQDNKQIKAQWKIKNNTVSFKIGAHDKNKVLIIDPVVVTRLWGTYYGSSSYDESEYALVDAASNIYLVGQSASSSNIATVGAFQTILNGFTDVMIVKLTANNVRLWATYFGGNDQEDLNAAAIDGNANIFLGGNTKTTTGLSSPGAYQPNNAGGNFDIFAAKFDSSGTRSWSTYIGGTDSDQLHSISTDGSSVFFVGFSRSDSNVTTPGSYQFLKSNGFDGLIAKFNSNGFPDWITYYGDIGGDLLYGSSIDIDGNIIVVGRTTSLNSIASPGAFKTSYSGSLSTPNTFIVKFDNGGNRIWGTYYGGGHTYAESVVTDRLKHIVVSGYTTSTTDISTTGTHQNSLAGNFDVYIVSFDSSGNRLWGTYYGGSGNELQNYCGVDDSLYIYVVGETESTSGIATPGSHQDKYGGGDHDGFLAKFDTTGNQVWGTYIGGTGDELPYSLTYDRSDSTILVTGYTTSSSDIATPGTYQDSLAAGWDAFLVKFGECIIDSVQIDTTVCASFKSPSGKHVWRKSGVYQDVLTNQNNCDSVLNINLTVNNTAANIIDTSCTTYLSPSGLHTYSVSGVYYDTIPNFAGCDSTLTIQLHVDTINTEVLQFNNLLVSQDSSATYQWIDCTTNSIIPGATSRVYTARENGIYAVILSQTGCSDTSNCYSVTEIGIEERNLANVRIQPNPSNGKIKLQLNQTLSTATVQLLSLNGRTLQTWNFEELEQTTLQLEVSSGMYLLEISSEGERSVHRVVVR